MKKQLSTIAVGLAMLLTTTTYASNKANTIPPKITAQEKAIKNFSRQFGSSITPKFYALENGFILQSSLSDLHVKSAYNNKGSWIYTISSFNPESYSKKVIEAVKDNYEAYSISGMQKVEQPGNSPVYIVSITNEKTIKMLRISNGEVEMINDYQKA